MREVKKVPQKPERQQPNQNRLSSVKGSFTAEFVEFRTRSNSFGDYFGLVLKNIKSLPSKKLVSDAQWFNLTGGFKKALLYYKDEELPGKIIKFKGVKETYKKGYYAYRDNVLVERPDELEYKIVRPANIEVCSR